VGEVFGMQHNDRLAESRCHAGVKGGVPLAVLVTEFNHHHVGFFNQSARADGVHLRTLMIFPEGIVLLTQNFNAAIVAGFMIGHRRHDLHRQIFGLTAIFNLFPPVAVDFT